MDHHGLLWQDTTYRCPGAIIAGQEIKGNSVFVARSLIGGHLKTGKFVDGWGMYVSHSGQEHKEPAFQLLTNPRNVCVKWQHGNGRIIPSNAVVGGVMNGMHIYIGRWRHEGSIVVGHITPWDGQLWYSWQGREYSSSTFDILLAFGSNCRCNEI